METVNMHQAKTHLSRLVEKAVKGEPFIIARAGKPLVKVVALEAPEVGVKSRFGFLKGQITVPEIEQFKELGRKEIEAMFTVTTSEVAPRYTVIAVERPGGRGRRVEVRFVGGGSVNQRK